MKKILIILAIILTSCSSRKVILDKSSTELKTEEVSSIKEEATSTQDNYVSVVSCTDEIEIIPIDTTKHIEVNGKRYKNVKLRHKKTKTVLLDTSKIKTSKTSLIETSAKKEFKEKIVKKEVEKKQSYWIFFILLFVVLVYAYKRINKTLF